MSFDVSSFFASLGTKQVFYLAFRKLSVYQEYTKNLSGINKAIMSFDVNSFLACLGTTQVLYPAFRKFLAEQLRAVCSLNVA